MYIASLVLLSAAAVSLALGIQTEGVTLLFLSIACSALAAGSAGIAAVRRMRRGRRATGP